MQNQNAAPAPLGAFDLHLDSQQFGVKIIRWFLLAGVLGAIAVYLAYWTFFIFAPLILFGLWMAIRMTKMESVDFFNSKIRFNKVYVSITWFNMEFLWPISWIPDKKTFEYLWKDLEVVTLERRFFGLFPCLVFDFFPQRPSCQVVFLHNFETEDVCRLTYLLIERDLLEVTTSTEPLMVELVRLHESLT